MAIILVIINFLSIVVICLLLNEGFRGALVKASIISSVEILGILEIFSLFHRVTYINIAVSWVVLSVIDIAILVYLLSRRGGEKNRKILNISSWIDFLRNNKLAVFIIGVLLVGTGLIAIIAPPNTFDSMTYHMPRVSHWIQQKSIRFYPTSISRQNYSMPFAEYAILIGQILSTSDRFANFVQWNSYLFVIILATLISKELGLSKHGQLFSGLICATLPMAILQSGTSQNDLVVAFYSLGFYYFFTRLIDSNSIQDAFFTSASFGLALLTKGTGYLFCAAIGIVLGISYLWSWKEQIGKSLMMLASIIMLASVINLGHLVRTNQYFQDPLFDSNQRTIVDRVSLRITGKNILRNAVVHLATPIPAFNREIELAVANILGSDHHDPEAIFQGSEFSIDFHLDEDSSGNMVHLLIFLIAGPLALVLRPHPSFRSLKKLLFVILISIVLYSAALKWQPWTSRLQTTIFLLGSIFSAGVFSKLWINDTWTAMISIFLALMCLPFMLLSTTRPVLPIIPGDSAIKSTKLFLYIGNKIDKFLIAHPDFDETIMPIKLNYLKGESIFLTDREQQYFFASSSIYEGYEKVVGAAREIDPDQVGLVLSSNSWEYPIWVLFGRHSQPGRPVLIHVFVDKLVRYEYAFSQDLPPVLISTFILDQRVQEYYGYDTIMNFDYINLYMR